MPEFNYEAMASTGIRSQGTLVAGSEREVMAMLDARGLFPVRIDVKKAIATGSIGRKKVSSRHLATYYSQQRWVDSSTSHAFGSEVSTMILRSTLPGSGRRQLSTRAAFTLLEVLVVVAIIVMLASIGGYYTIQQYEFSKKVSQAKVECNTLSGQVETYKRQNGDYPQTIEALSQGASPLVPLEKTRDPWGKPYIVDPNGPHNGGNKADVYTTTPKGQVIGNFSN